MLRRTKSSVAVTATIMVALTGGLTSAFGAQKGLPDETLQGVITCDGLTSPEEQLACVDANVESPEATSDISSHDPPSREPEVGPPANGGESSETRNAMTRDSQQTSPKPISRSPGARVGLLEAMEAPSVMESNNLYRRESRLRDNLTSMPLEATIVSVRVHHDGRFSVQLDNGEIWRETRRTKMRTPEPGRSAAIYKNGPGGYRMRIEENPRVAWVRRSDPVDQ